MAKSAQKRCFHRQSMAEGVDFEFATGKRTPFLNLVDPSTIAGKISPFTFNGAAGGPMVPDDPGASHPDRVWRRLASAVSAGVSYREPGLKSSLHIAIRQDGAMSTWTAGTSSPP